jgi:hypothetical protein
MAEQDVRVRNLPDSGSPERVAYDLWRFMKGPFEKGESKEAQKRQLLDLYAECLEATRGFRDFSR